MEFLQTKVNTGPYKKLANESKNDKMKNRRSSHIDILSPKGGSVDITVKLIYIA